jgi:phosphatidylglycerol:prolipoprotein diacylglycerol transferase
LVSLVAGLVGGRIGFVWAQWSYFQERPQEMWQVWQGGLSYHGALLAGLVALWAWSVVGHKRAAFTAYATLLAPSFALGHAFGWLACWLEGCAYGREAVIGPLAADLPDHFGVYALRYQTQLLGIGLSLLVFLLVLGWRRRRSPDSSFWIALSGISLSRAAISLLRGDPVPHLNGLRADTLLDALLALVALLLWLYQARVRPSRKVLSP